MAESRPEFRELCTIFAEKWVEKQGRKGPGQRRKSGMVGVEPAQPADAVVYSRYQIFLLAAGGWGAAIVLEWRSETLKSNSRGLFERYDTGGFYDEMFVGSGRAAAALCQAVPHPGGDGAGAVRRAAQDGRPFLPAAGHHVYGVQRRRGDGEALPFRSDSADCSALGVAAGRARADAARDGAEPVSAGYLRRRRRSWRTSGFRAR